MGATKQQLETQLSELNKAWNAEKLTIVKNIDIGLEPVQDYTEFGGRVTQYFIADDIYDVSAIRAVHNIAQTSADGAALQVAKATSTTAPSIGSDAACLITDGNGGTNIFRGFDLKGIAAHVVTNCTLTTATATLRLAVGDRLVYGCNGTLSSTVITLITTLTRVRTP